MHAPLLAFVRPALVGALALLSLACGRVAPRAADPPRADLETALPLASGAGDGLRGPADFDVVTDRTERSRALFLEATKVMFHPRCANCHPSGDVPLQGMQQQPHDPPVERGPRGEHGDHGLPALSCETCHQDHNVEHARIPGAPKWALAPLEMAWVGRTPHALCEQLKDKKRNGGKTLAEIVQHSAHDPLVAWGWSPGHGREPAPGSQAIFGALMAAWVDTGAACPKEKQ